MGMFARSQNARATRETFRAIRLRLRVERFPLPCPEIEIALAAGRPDYFRT